MGTEIRNFAPPMSTETSQIDQVKEQRPHAGVETWLARTISFVFHPLVMPTASVWLMFQLPTYLQYHYSDQQKNLIYLILLLCTFVMPGLAALYLLRKGIVTSFDIEERSERWIPYFVTFIFYVFAYLFMSYLGVNTTILSITLAAAVAVFAGMFINTLFKISVHLTAIGGVVGVLAALSVAHQIDAVLWLYCSILVAGMLGFSRLKLKRHHPREVYAGFMLGFCCEYLIVVNGIG